MQPREAVLYGRELAKLHQGLAALAGRVEYPSMNLAKQLEQSAIPGTLKAADKYGKKAALEALAAEMAFAWFPQLELLPEQLIHRDPHPGNMAMAEDGTVGFLDFELSVSGIRLFDIGYFSTSQWVRGYTPQKNAEPWLNLVASLLQGYEEISPLSQSERASAFYVICAIQLLFITYFQGLERLDLVVMNLEALLGLLRKRDSIEHLFESRQTH